MEGGQAVSIIELLEKVGAENVQIQNVGSSATEVQRKKNHTEITVMVPHEMGDSITHILLGKEGPKIGLILWLPTSMLTEKEDKP
jgi:hypothetical protein